MAIFYAKPPKGTPLQRMHPLAGKLEAAFLMRDKAGTKLRSDTGESPFDQVVQTSTLSFGNAPGGSDTTFNGTAYTLSPTPLLLSAPMSFFCRVRLTTVGSGATAILAIGNSNVDANPLMLLQYSSVAGQLRMLLGDATFTALVTSPSAGVWYDVMGSVNKSAGTEVAYASIAGSPMLPVNSASRTFGVVHNTSLYLGTGFNGAKDCDIECAYVWSRALTAKDARLLTDPYSMYRRRRIPVPLGAASSQSPVPILDDHGLAGGLLLVSGGMQ